MFIHQSDRGHHGKLCEDLENAFAKGNDDYSKNLVSAYHLINEFKCWQPKQSVPNPSGVAFAQTKGKGIAKGDNKDKDDSWQKKFTCHHCNKVGHIRPNCPKLIDDEDAQDDDEVDTLSKSPKDKLTKSSLKKKTTFAQATVTDDSGNESESENQFVNFGFCTTTSAPLKLRDMILLDNQSAND
jgi:hypothetical protein